MGCRLAEAVWIYFFFDGYFSLSLLKSELNSDINQLKLSPIYIQQQSLNHCFRVIQQQVVIYIMHYII